MTDDNRTENDKAETPSVKVGVASQNINSLNIASQNIVEQQNIFNPTSTPPPTGLPINLPRMGTGDLIGRDDMLKNLYERLNKSNRLVPTALCGIGGIGKTAIAYQYALNYLDAYEGGVCWIYARDSDVGTQILDFARSYLGLDLPPEADTQSKLDFCWSHWRKGNVLIIFDDVTSFERLYPLLPPAYSRFTILATTRLQSTLRANIRFLEVGLLESSDALRLLEQKLDEADNRIQEEPEKAIELCQWVDYLPLGLEIVGHYLNRKKDLSIAGMLIRLEEEKLTVLNQSGQHGIEAAFELSWKELSDAAKELCFTLSLFALAPIPWWMVELLLWEQLPKELEELRDEHLLRLSLLQRQEHATYQFHHLTREFIQSKLSASDSSEQKKRMFCQGMVNIVSLTFSNEIPDTAKETSALIVIAHIEEVASIFPHLIDSDSLFSVHLTLQIIYNQQGTYEKSVIWGEKCDVELTSRLGQNHKLVIINLTILASTYLQQSKLEKAEKMFANSLDVIEFHYTDQAEQVDEDYNLLSMDIMSELGRIRAAQGIFEQAERNCRTALEAQHKIIDSRTPLAILTTVKSICSLAEVLYIKGRYEEADSFYDRAWAFEGYQDIILTNNPFYIVNHFRHISHLYLEQGRTEEAEYFAEEMRKIVEGGFGSEHPLYAERISSLAEIYLAQGKHQEAEEFGQQAIDICERKGLTGHSTYASSLMTLGVIYIEQDRFDDAGSYYQKALEVWRQLFGADHEKVAQSLIKIAVLYLAQGQYDVAESLLQQGEGICKSALGTAHPRYGEFLFYLAQVRGYQQKYDLAKETLEEAIAVFETAFGENHPKVADKVSLLGFFLLSQGNYKEAEPLFEKLLSLAKEIYGENHPKVCEYILFLAELHYANSNESKAKALYSEAIDIYKKEQDESTNPDFSEGLVRLVELYKAQGRFEDVEALHKRLLSTSRELLDKEHPDLLQLLTRLARFYVTERNYESALPLWEEALRIRSAIFRENHPSIAADMVNLAYVHHALNHFEKSQKLYGQALEIRIHEYGESHYKVDFIQKALVSLRRSWERHTGKAISLLSAPQHPPEDDLATTSTHETDKKELGEKGIVDEHICERKINEREVAEKETELDDSIVSINNELQEKKLQNERKAAELEDLKQKKEDLESKATRLQEQHLLLREELEKDTEQIKLQQANVLDTAKRLISLTHAERERLSEPLRVVLVDLEEQRNEYLREQQRLEEAIASFNEYGESTDDIYTHLNMHYQKDCEIGELLPLDRQSIESSIQLIREHLAQIDNRLARARIKHEKSQSKKVYRFR